MNPNEWLEKAERLRTTLTQLREARHDQQGGTQQEIDIIERTAIAHWLRQEFSDEPPEDTSTLPLFVTTHL